jgi:hypothetical protein
MTPEQFEIFLKDNRESTAEAIEKTVNGKIRAVHQMLEDQNNQNSKFHEKVENHIKTVEPYILGIESTKLVASWFGKSMMYIGAFVLTVGGAYVFLKTKLTQ